MTEHLTMKRVSPIIYVTWSWIKQNSKIDRLLSFCPLVTELGLLFNKTYRRTALPTKTNNKFQIGDIFLIHVRQQIVKQRLKSRDCCFPLICMWLFGSGLSVPISLSPSSTAVLVCELFV